MRKKKTAEKDQIALLEKESPKGINWTTRTLADPERNRARKKS